MLIAGFQTLTLTDFPGHTAAVVFTQGCNFQCPFCHNSDLWPLTREPSCLVPGDHVLEVLARRSQVLDGVVMTGGEPTLQPDLKGFIRQVRSLGLAVKLDTNGSRPAVLRDLLGSGLLDFVAMDVKAPLGKYGELAGCVVTIPDIQESIGLIRESGIKYLFRTTWVKPLLHACDIAEIKRTLGPETPHHTQQFVAEHAVNCRLRH
ncbi:MAG: anaerobic ribonucleoside-triphosphate reductase activating protein [Phycisphaerae bacterium]|nr:anaerobic ribonucleoside-triphosphate reductase activating protein [Phycisphaerae bacterium]